MAIALSYPTISGVSSPPYLSALSETANIQNTINFLYYGSADSGTTPRTSLSTSSGIYGMLSQLQTQISSLQSGINVHENARYATAATITGTYSAGSADNSATPGTGLNAYITFTATGAQSIDGGASLILGDRVLVKDGTTIGAAGTTSSIANGIYVVQSDGIGGQSTLTPTFSNGSATKVVLVRSTDANNSLAGDFAEGDFLYISDGSTNANEAFMLTTSSATGGAPTGTIRIGTDTVTYNQFIGVGSYYLGTTAAQITSANQALTGISSIALPGATSGTITLTPTATAGTNTITLPATTGTVYVSSGTDVTLADGGTNASLTASNGGIVWSNATQLQILAGTATAGKLLRSGATATPAWSTATFPDAATGTGTILRADGTNWVATTATYPTTTSAFQLLYSSAANIVGQITAPTTNGTYSLVSVVSASTAVAPTWTTATGTGSPVFATSPTFATSIDGSATLGAFASSTALTIGYTAGANSTTNISTGGVGTSATKTLNIGTGAVTAGTTVINLGGNPAVSSSTINLNGGVKVNGLISTNAAAPTIASANTIAPTTQIVFVSGTTAIATITAPSPISTTGGQITIIPTGVFTTTTAGNIALASTAVVSRALIMTYDTTTTKWYPSY